MPNKPLVLIIMDGWGVRDSSDFNAIKLAKDQTVNNLAKQYPSTTLGCSGESVGLPEGQMGNSEVGHLNIGAGRIVYQELTRITKSIKDGDFFKNKALLDAVDNIKKNKTNLHIMGLVSDGGVHSDNEHLYALLDLAKRNNINNVYVHCFMDGRDTPPESGKAYIEELQDKMKELGTGKIATITGRYYAMDRDKRWDRVSQAYDAMTSGAGVEESDPVRAMQNAYDRKETDEFIKPVVMKGGAKISDNDSVIFFNFRGDRAREITRCFTDDPFDGFTRKVHPKTHFVCLTQYDVTIKTHVAFPPQELKNILAEVLSRNGKKQLRIAETEKYAHVTLFFNGGVEKPTPNEDRILLPSPKVATYDLKPEMSAYEVTARVISEIETGKYDVVIMNYANCDMVGHSGMLDATIKAVEVVNKCVGRVADAVKKQGGITMVTADHGNAEQKYDYETKCPHTAHTCNRVPFILVSEDIKAKLRDNGILADIAPTILSLLSIKQPKEMTGQTLISP
jgi:2,3-bisphosphoglycerate-independent phosphoglycerate mutase